MSPEARVRLIDRFTAACREDRRVVAAFLGGSLAAGTADEFSDLDLYLITSDEEYRDFFDERRGFMRRLGDPVFCEDFSEFGFDMVLFIYAEGPHGELALAPASNFLQIHGGPYKVLLDKTQMLRTVTFPYYFAPDDEKRRTLRHLIYWFWRDLLHCGKYLARGRVWTAAAYLEDLRRKVVKLAQMHADWQYGGGGYDRVELVLPVSWRARAAETFVPLEAGRIAEAARILTGLYLDVAPTLARAHGLDYPEELQRTVEPSVREIFEGAVRR
jgi:hypothetical protein